MTSLKSLFVNIVNEMIFGCALSLLICLLDNSRAQNYTPFMIHYDYEGNFSSIKHSVVGTLVHNETVTFKFDSILILDFGSEHFLTSITIGTRHEALQNVNVTLGIRGNYNKGEQKFNKCYKIDKWPFSTFTCQKQARFAQIHTNQTLEVISLKVEAEAIYAELYIGCFQHNNSFSRQVKDVTECIKFCDFINNTYAGVKDSKCGCYQDLNAHVLANHTECHMKCGYEQLCTKNVNYVPMYFTDYDRLEGPENVSMECILSEKETCNNCRPGYKGIFCDKRDCTVNNGDCGKYPCFDYNNTFITYDAKCLCPDGFQNDVISVCKDINECTNPHKFPCTWRQYCWNVPGSYKCGCKRGFNTTEDNDCIDIDECLVYAICDEKTSECLNNQGSFVCQCRTGFKPHNETKNVCIDINECEGLTGYCPSTCTNTIGSFYCQCPVGYIFGNSSACEDVDECLVVTLCDSLSTVCYNTEGSFGCNCSKGFSRGSTYKCEDINECLLNTHTCDKTSTCRNFPGFYTCQCSHGLKSETYEYVRTCVDIDECSMSDDEVCEANKSLCLNTYGSFRCQCMGGYVNKNEFKCKLRSNKTTSTELVDLFTVEYSLMGDDSQNIRLLMYGIVSILLLIVAGVAITINTIITKKPVPPHVPRYNGERIDTSVTFDRGEEDLSIGSHTLENMEVKD